MRVGLQIKIKVLDQLYILGAVQMVSEQLVYMTMLAMTPQNRLGKGGGVVTRELDS